MFEPKTEERAGSCRKLHTEKVHRCTACKVLGWSRWVGHVACIRDQRKQVQSLIGEPEGNSPLRRAVYVVGRIVLKCMLNRTGGFGLFLWCRREMGICSFVMVMNFCEHGDELLSSIKFSKFLDYLSDFWHLEKDYIVSGIILSIVIFLFCNKGYGVFVYARCLNQCIKLFCIVVLTIVTTVQMTGSCTVCLYSVMYACT